MGILKPPPPISGKYLTLLMGAAIALCGHALFFHRVTANNDTYGQLLAEVRLLHGIGYGQIEDGTFAPYCSHPPALSALATFFSVLGLDPLVVMLRLQAALLVATYILLTLVLARAVGWVCASLISLSAHATQGVLQSYMSLHTEPFALLLVVWLFLIVVRTSLNKNVERIRRASLALVLLSWGLTMFRYAGAFFVLAAVVAATTLWFSQTRQRVRFIAVTGGLSALPLFLLVLRNVSSCKGTVNVADLPPYTVEQIVAELRMGFATLMEVAVPRIARIVIYSPWFVGLALFTLAMLTCWLLTRRVAVRGAAAQDWERAGQSACLTAFLFAAVYFAFLVGTSAMTGFSFVGMYRSMSPTVFWLSVALFTGGLALSRGSNRQHYALFAILLITSAKLVYGFYHEIIYSEQRVLWSDYRTIASEIVHVIEDRRGGADTVLVDTALGFRNRNLYRLLRYSHKHFRMLPWRLRPAPGAVSRASLLSPPVLPTARRTVLAIVKGDYDPMELRRLQPVERPHSAVLSDVLLIPWSH